MQIPFIRPSRFRSSSITASVTAGLRKKAVMNLPRAIRLIAAGEAAGDGDDLALTDQLGEGVGRLLDFSGGTVASPRRSRGQRPPWQRTLATSYSQLVPGNTGISTRGLANFGRCAAITMPPSKRTSGAASLGVGMLVGIDAVEGLLPAAPHIQGRRWSRRTRRIAKSSVVWPSSCTAATLAHALQQNSAVQRSKDTVSTSVPDLQRQSRCRCPEPSW